MPAVKLAEAALVVIGVNDGAGREIEALGADIVDDADDGEGLQVAVHVAEFDGLADGVLVGPALAGKGLADEGGVGAVGVGAGVEEAAADEGNFEGAEVGFAGDAVEGLAGEGRIMGYQAPLREVGGGGVAAEEQEGV